LSRPSPNQAQLGDYEALLELAGPDLYRHNAFRITGLSTIATTREIGRQLERIKMSEKIGSLAVHSTGFLPLDPPANIDLVRESIHRLRNPERRLIEEFFWFWPSEEADVDSSHQLLLNGDIRPAIEVWTKNAYLDDNPVSIHNLAIASHCSALDLEWTDCISVEGCSKRDSDWQQAYKYWFQLVNFEESWTVLVKRIRTLDEPQLTTGMARRIRESLPLALLLVNARLAVKFAEEQSSAEVVRQIRIMRESGFDDEDIEEALRRAVSTIFGRIKSLCRSAKEKANDVPNKANEVAYHLLEQVREPLRVISRVLPSGNSTRNDIRDEVALTSLTCQISYGNETEDWEGALTLGELALAVAAGGPAKSRILASLKILGENISGRERQNLFDRITNLVNSTDAPQRKFLAMKEEILPELEKQWSKIATDDESTVFAMDICAKAFRSIAIDLHNDHAEFDLAYEAITIASTYCRSHELTVQISKDVAILSENSQLAGQRKAVPGHGFGQARDNVGAAGMRPRNVPVKSRYSPSWRVLVGAVVCVVIGINVVWLANQSSPTTQNANVNEQPNSGASPSPATPANRNSSLAMPLSTRNANNRATLAPTPDIAPVYIQPSEGPGPSESQISQLHDEIEDGKARIDAMKQELNSVSSQLESYKSRIDSSAEAIERMESNSRLGIEVDNYRYKRLVAEHNADVERHNSILETYREKLTLHNELLDATNQKVRQYNLLIRSRK
jgi:hypothetical protein